MATTLALPQVPKRIEVYDWAWGRGMESQLVDRLGIDPVHASDALVYRL